MILGAEGAGAQEWRRIRGVGGGGGMARASDTDGGVLRRWVGRQERVGAFQLRLSGRTG